MSKGRHRRPEPQYQALQAPVLPFAMPAPPPFDASPGVSVQVLGSKNATVAKVVLSKQDWNSTTPEKYRFEVRDSAKREQGDVHDPETGELLALARTFQRLSRQLFSEGNKRVKASVAAQEAARREAYEKAHAPKVAVPRRTKEEWEAIQRRQTAAAAAEEYVSSFPEPAVRYNPHDAEILSRWISKPGPRPSSIRELREARDSIDLLLKQLGEVE